MKHEPFFSYSKITDQIYLGSSQCCGEHTEQYLGKLSDLDIFCEIDLRQESDPLTDALPVKLHLPTVDTFPPTLEQTKIGVEVIDSIVNMEKNVYVHCQIAHGRSPTLVIAYFMLKKGMSYNEAFNLVKSKRPEIHPTDKQVEFLALLEK